MSDAGDEIRTRLIFTTILVMAMVMQDYAHAASGSATAKSAPARHEERVEKFAATASKCDGAAIAQARFITMPARRRGRQADSAGKVICAAILMSAGEAAYAMLSG